MHRRNGMRLGRVGLALAAMVSVVCTGASAQETASNAPLSLAPGAAQPADPLARRIRQGFADSFYGQLHYLTAQPEAGLPTSRWKTPLVMFHQSPGRRGSSAR